MKKTFTLALCCFFIILQAQTDTKAATGYKVMYSKSSNGTLVSPQDPILVYTTPNETLVTSEKMNSGTAEFPYEQSFINRGSNKLIQITQLHKNQSATTADSTSLSKQNFEFLTETKTILGYKCQKAKTIINSNTIEIW